MEIETFRINHSGSYEIEIKKDGVWTSLEIPFERNLFECDSEGRVIRQSDHFYNERTLEKDEYVIAGDNWLSSLDCVSAHKTVTYDDLIGVVVEMQGRCCYDPNTQTISNLKPYATRHFWGVDY